MAMEMDMIEYFRGKPLRTGDKAQLLLDDYIIEDTWKLARVLHQPMKWFKNPILYQTEPWEGEHVGSPFVMWDKEFGCYRMWYSSFVPANYYSFSTTGPSYFMCYAESEDGINWRKPKLDVCRLPGFEKTNVIYYGADGKRGSGQVFKDEDEKDPEKRYKMVCLEQFPWKGGYEGYTSGVRILYSPDGLKWNPQNAYFVLDYHSDANNHVVFDRKNHRWLLYCRPIIYASGRSSGLRHHRRRVTVMVSEDLVHWSYPRMVMFPDEKDRPDYDHVFVTLYGNYFLMFYGAMEGDTTGIKDTFFAWSRDGFHWERFYTRQPFLPRGNENSWDAGEVLTYSMVERGEDLLLYYAGHNRGQHQQGIYRNGIGVAFLKQDRFVEQKAGNEPGYLLTREFICEGKFLKLNTGFVSMPDKQQRIRVEILHHPPLGKNAHFNQIYNGYGLEDCNEISTNRVDVPVTWKTKKDLSGLVGKPLYLRFELLNMGLFSFRLSDE
jgi:hypothetical protein